MMKGKLGLKSMQLLTLRVFSSVLFLAFTLVLSQGTLERFQMFTTALSVVPEAVAGVGSGGRGCCEAE